MFTKYKFLPILSIFITAVLISACSSSTSSSSATGQIPTGQYTGNLNGQINGATGTSQASVTSTRLLLNIITEIDTSTSPGTISDPFGSVSVIGGDRCFSSGTILAGSSLVNGNQMSLGIQTDQTGVLRLTGQFSDDSYTGTFTLSNSTTCGGPISGGFDLTRN